MIFNTTEVGTGRRRILSPFRFGRDILRFFPVGTEKLSLLEAAVNSARFPWITPPKKFWDPREKRDIQLVDGAYFDNSGVSTASALLKSLDAVLLEDGLQKDVALHLIVVTKSFKHHKVDDSFPELTAPVTALMRSREARSSQEIRNVIDERGDSEVSVIKLRDMGLKMPLGWWISDVTLLLIRSQNGQPSRCRKFYGPAGQVFDADCFVKSMFAALQSGATGIE